VNELDATLLEKESLGTSDVKESLQMHSHPKNLGVGNQAFAERCHSFILGWAPNDESGIVDRESRTVWSLSSEIGPTVLKPSRSERIWSLAKVQVGRPSLTRSCVLEQRGSSCDCHAILEVRRVDCSFRSKLTLEPRRIAIACL
jgi:hypothetical protein